MRRLHAFRLPLIAAAVTLATGCAGNGCGTIKPLPKDPAPTGFPMGQQIEGGMQVRLTKSGFDKVAGLVPAMMKQTLGAGFCATEARTLINVWNQKLVICDGASAVCANGQGCEAKVDLQKINISLADAKEPVMVADVQMDVSVPLLAHLKTLVFDGSCTLDVFTKHTKDASADPAHIVAKVKMSIDKTTGYLKLGLDGLQIVNLGLDTSGCGILGDALSTVLGWVQSDLGTMIINWILPLLNSTLDKMIQNFLPKTPGLAGIISTGEMLKAMGAPEDASLEMHLVAGGYVASSGGGLTLGVISGMNSDRDISSRGPGQTSEPSLCVPARPAPTLNDKPWNLPNNPDRPDVTLKAAGAFAGMPDPTGSKGQTLDLALGISRSFLDLAGFHAYNSGTLCLQISGSTLEQLNAGALALLIPSLTNVVEKPKAPMALAIRPMTPFTFHVGAGTAADPLVNVNVNDMRIDFYAFIEDHYVRIFTLAADMTIKVDLQITEVGGQPAILPMVSGIDKQSVKLRVINTDLLAEGGDKLAAKLGNLLDIAVPVLAGALKPFPLPAVMGISIQDLGLTKVSTTEDDFIAVTGGLKIESPTMKYDPQAGGGRDRAPEKIHTTARVVEVLVPPAATISDAIDRGSLAVGESPSVTLELGAYGSSSGPTEWSVRVDEGTWKPWTHEARRTVLDAAFFLQTRHTIDVRARVAGDWRTEDPTPVRLSVLIDAVAPTLRTVVDGDRLELRGLDNASDEGALLYAWKTPSGWTAFSRRAELSRAEAWAAARDGAEPLRIAVQDEAGNRTEVAIDLRSLEGFALPVPSADQGGCSVGGHGDAGGLLLLGLLPLALLALRRRALLALLAVLALGAQACDEENGPKGCKLDDDCRDTTCELGKIPQCQSATCACVSDLYLGDVGRYSSMALRGTTAYVAAYNNTYGDLMIGHVVPPGVISNWEFVDGIPEDVPPDNPTARVRGGITDPGDDVGKYTSIGVLPTGDPVIAYHDATGGSLRYASFGVVRWNAQVVDKGLGVAASRQEEKGRWASLTLAKDGSPGIAYYAQLTKGASGKPEGQLRFAQARSPNPVSTSDWNIAIVDTRPLAMTSPADPLPRTVGVYCSAARKADGAPVIAYYDSERGNLRYVEGDTTGKTFSAPKILDGEGMGGVDTGDVGQFPSVVVDGNATHITYVDATRDNLLYINTRDMKPEVIDDGYRAKDEKTIDGVDAPVFHLVGDHSSLAISQGVILVAYQDSTVEQLRIAVRDATSGKWKQSTIAGHGSPFKGAYGFWAQARASGGIGYLSTYGVNQQLETPSFFVETFAVSLGGIM